MAHSLDFSKEEKGWSLGYSKIAGVDEAGRGPLAGPVVAAAVTFPTGFNLAGLQDSKKLSVKKREELFESIQASADVGIGIISHKKIDQINILQAARLAMREAVSKLKEKPDCVLIDGNMKIDVLIPQQPIVRGDSQVASIAAASIIAKVTRDRLMTEYHESYPEYGFNQHKGYPTLFHRKVLRQKGPSPIHRLSFRAD